ncbi:MULTISPECIES: preprotein translocase subunit SecY [unclassified Chamaesiphon]|uniref:preprotein translocase subunit SecY n=1 Tax=unclassified Chamaesiphon TaxID=2620921 RepID=UPI00286B6D49|nr:MULTISPECIES: preprotein translocase subunit SecY [unclassified Chamaesiphon]
MDASREKAPSPQETFVQMAQAAGLRGRVLVTLGLLILARLGTFVPIPGIDRVAFAESIKNSPTIGFLDIFSGGALSTVGVFALGIIPYINASIIIQLLTTALPALEKLQKEEGEAGRRKISQITRYVAVGWALIYSFGISQWLQKYTLPGHQGIAFVIGTVLALTAGSMFVMWISELITERGIGNGASLLIFLNIVAVLPTSLKDTIDLAQSGDSSILTRTVALLLVFIVMTVGIVFVQEGTRRIPIISARRQVGRRIQRERTSYLPLRLNQGGVMPIIFASSVLVLPSALASFVGTNAGNSPVTTWVTQVANFLAPGQPAHVAFYVVLIVFFSYFYSSLVVNPVDMAQNLKKMGASIPGIRPGVATSKYIEGILSRLTLLGALFLGIVATVPTAIESSLGVSTFKGFGATSLLILVSVAIDTAKQIQTLVISQRYEGMVNNKD